MSAPAIIDFENDAFTEGIPHELFRWLRDNDPVRWSPTAPRSPTPSSRRRRPGSPAGSPPTASRRGSIAALTMHPRREQVVLVHALMKVGAVLLPLSPRLTEAERAAIVAAEEPSVDLDDPGELTQTEADMPLLGEHDMDDICCRVLTSGSTGTPQPVGLTYGNFLWSAVGSAFNIGVEPGDRWLCCLPLSHIAGLWIVMRSVIYGTTAVLHDGFDVDRVAASLERGRDHGRLAGDDDADPAARGRRRPLRAAGDPGRRRPGARGAARRGDRPAAPPSSRPTA